ncbi:RagB/SusD family nutrient uptake outer membrane protein [Algoriphagus persicinus]|uniref:RagB/SusD family nutrient uptake outer membrane protein n=1 Tax=Algoriphagus persicinus TaxID=3108754 RepID=UPI002B3F2B4C|nr:RagB/SusD family nutrient uptake outer membrane protein [Algoriphagus sp. E1-3-M2]MEB2786618.1 RagB/SusD family nutrient uptake outer membrane protein [Algoriphagus sp. E1-3-M2]
MKILKTFAFTIGLLSLTVISCDDSLDLAPLGELNSETFYVTEEHFEAASLGPYSALLNFYYDQGGLGHYNGIEYPSDDSQHGGQGSEDNVDFIWLPNNGNFSYMYNTSYTGILRANAILDRIPASELSQEQKNRFEAEAKFMRAYFYYFLARHWGTPPLISAVQRSVEDTRTGNSAPGEVYALVESDLNFAKEHLPSQWDASNTGRATSGAATALLGKAYLTQQKYTEAAQEFNEVVSSGVYTLMEDFGDNFREDKENNAESIFEIQFSRGDFNPWLPVDFGLAGNQNVGHAGTGRAINFRASCFLGSCAPGANGQGYGRIHATEGLQNSFEEGDPRVPFTIFREGDEYFGELFDPAWSITGATPSKYLLNYVSYPQPNAGSNNERVIRLADVYLMLAEAELLGNNNVQKAADLVNMVRRRADPSGDILPDRSGSASEMMEYIMHERRVELAFEGHRYDDLVRWQNAGKINIATDVDFSRSLANQNWNETYLLKPFPQRELDLVSILTQNPGY